MSEPEEPAVRGSASFLRTLQAVFWSFFGVRKQSDLERDARELNPVYVVIAGVLGAALFIATLLVVVHLAVQ